MKKQPHERLLEDIAAVRKLFAQKSFKGYFDMGVVGRHPRGSHKPIEKNYCGTSACLAGWLAIASEGENGFKGEWDSGYYAVIGGCRERAVKVYGISLKVADDLFFSGFDKDIEEKLGEATAAAKAIAARSKKKKSQSA